MIKMNVPEYVRVAVIVEASLFAALYLDQALARFDTISDSVIAASTWVRHSAMIRSKER